MGFNAAILRRRRRTGGGSGLSITAPSAVLFADGDQPYALTGAEKLAFSFNPSLYKGLDGSFDYYIDATNGSDGNAGTSEGAAWASLNKINAVSFANSTTYRFLVKADTYDTANDFVDLDLTTGPVSNVVIEIVFEPGCIIDGTNYSTENAFQFDAAAADRTNTFRIYGNGLIVQNVTTTTGNGWNPIGGVNEIYDVKFDNCRDCMSVSGDSLSRAYDCYATNALKWPIAAGSSCETYWYRCVFDNTGDTATLGGLTSKTSSSIIYMEDCIWLPGSTGIHKTINFNTGVSEIVRGRVGTTSVSVIIGNAADLTIEASFINVSADTNKTMDFQSCYGKMSMRQRNGGSLTVEGCIISGPATGFSNIFYSNFDPGSGSPHYVRDNIFETATAAAFMSYDATNAGYLVAAGSEFFNNILSGSAAFDADLVSADSGGTVIVDNVTDDALIGAANTLDPDDYGYAAGSPAIGAGVSGGNCGFAVGGVAALNPQTGRVTVTLGIDSGNLSLSQTTELTFTTGDGSADASMVFYGYIYYVLAALDGTEVDGLSSEQADISYSVLHDATVRTASKTISVTSQPDPSNMLMETGDILLMETGDALLLEA